MKHFSVLAVIEIPLNTHVVVAKAASARPRAAGVVAHRYAQGVPGEN